MAKKSIVLFPKTEAMLKVLGENLRLARLRRNIPMTLQAARVGISVATLTAIEKGASGVSIGAYLQVLVALGLEKDILKVGADDELGRKLQDAGLAVRARAPKRSKK